MKNFLLALLASLFLATSSFAKVPWDTIPYADSEGALFIELLKEAGVPTDTISVYTTTPGTVSYTPTGLTEPQTTTANNIRDVVFPARWAKIQTFNAYLAGGVTVNISGSNYILPADPVSQLVYTKMLNRAQSTHMLSQPVVSVLGISVVGAATSNSKVFTLPRKGSASDITITGTVPFITALTSYFEQIDTEWQKTR